MLDHLAHEVRGGRGLRLEHGPGDDPEPDRCLTRLQQAQPAQGAVASCSLQPETRQRFVELQLVARWGYGQVPGGVWLPRPEADPRKRLPAVPAAFSRRGDPTAHRGLSAGATGRPGRPVSRLNARTSSEEPVDIPAIQRVVSTGFPYVDFMRCYFRDSQDGSTIIVNTGIWSRRD